MSHQFYRDEELRNRLIARYEELAPDIPGGVGPGWQPVVGEAALALDEIASGWRCGQIKEKFGVLRFYIDAPEGSSFELFYAVKAIAAYAEGRSTGICEACGAYGKLRDSGGWIQTLCDEHAVERKRGRRPVPEAKETHG